MRVTFHTGLHDMVAWSFVDVATKYILKTTFSYPWFAHAEAPLKGKINNHDDDDSENVA